MHSHGTQVIAFLQKTLRRNASICRMNQSTVITLPCGRHFGEQAKEKIIKAKIISSKSEQKKNLLRFWGFFLAYVSEKNA